MTRLLLGTCSWKYPSWKGIFYPDTPVQNYLQEYARQLNTVEIDQWFWSLFSPGSVKLPDHPTVQAYRDSVGPDFKFSVKVANSITLSHYYAKYTAGKLVRNPHFLSPDLFSEFLQCLAPLRSRLGPLMFQFEYLNRKKMKRQSEFQQRFTEFINQVDRGYMYALELRNPGYLNEEFFEFLLENNLAMVFVQGYYMPDMLDVYEKAERYLTGFAVIRLMGSDRRDIELRAGNRWDRVLVDRGTELEKLAEIVDCLMRKKIDVYLNVNNHYEGSAPLTIRRLRERLPANQRGR